MRTFRQPASQSRTRTFGRGKPYVTARAEPASQFADDLRIFALTFVGGFLFMAVYLA
jgi:hypothetical protein